MPNTFLSLDASCTCCCWCLLTMPAHLATLLWMQRAVADHMRTARAEQGDSQRKLWEFVPSFTENKVDGGQAGLIHCPHCLNNVCVTMFA